MISFKKLLVIAALLLTVSAHPFIETTIHSIPVFGNDGQEQDVEIDDVDEIQVTNVDDMNFVNRAPSEKAIFSVKKVQTGFARTTNVGLTVQKGTSGIIHFRIRLKAVTVEQLALKASLFSKKLTAEQSEQLTESTGDYDGGFDIPWLKFLGIDLKKGTKKKDMKKARRHIVSYDKLAVEAKALLKETIAQKIEVRGTLKAKGVSFIPTTVFSFIRIAKVHFQDGSKLVVLSDHPGDTAAATRDGSKVVPHEVEGLEII